MVKKKIHILIFCILVSSSQLFAFLTPKLLAKFVYGHNLFGSAAESYKLGGGLAFELEFFDFLSSGIFLNTSSAKIFNATLNAKSLERGDLKALLIDAGFYIKPQLPISFELIMFTPYVSIGAGIPSFSGIHGEHASKFKNSYSFSQYYSFLVGLDITLAEHLILLGEIGVASNIRLSKPAFVLIPIAAHIGLGYRF